MGTGKTGRYLNTKGSATSISQYALVHSVEGTFTQPSKKTDVLRLKSGGHGQEGMDLLDKYHIKYHVEKTYSNGVRVGYVENHVDKHKSQGMNQSWFPKDWSSKKIKKAGEHVAKLKKNKNSKDGEVMYGTYKGVRVGVIKTNGKIATVFPDSIQKTY